MKIGITHRLFLSILTATGLALLCMFLIMQWSINRGFLQYLNAMGESRQRQTAVILEQAYAEHGSWDYFRENPGFLIERLLNVHSGDALSENLGELNRKRGVQPFPPPPEGVHRPRLPLVILDADRKPLVGNPGDAEDVNLRPIVHNKETVGYVAFLPAKQFLNPPQLQFLKQQKSALFLAVSGMVLVVIIFSIPLANRLVRPIKAMTAATRDLASGKYTIRVPVSSSDELGQLARDFNSMALILEKNEKARRQWVADISHELRTPLAVLRGEVEALLEGIRNTTPEAIRSLHAEVLRLHRLVDDLYQLALSDLGTLTYRKENIDLAQLLKESMELYRTEFARKDIALGTEFLQRSEITVFADRERLHQLFANLLDNSLKYTNPGGELVIRLACHSGNATIDFEDSAPGVPEDDLGRLFDRLYRVEGSRNRTTGGAGLGLTICRNIVEAHAGNIVAHPSPLGGVLIRVTLPVADQCS